jgi:hypothetical protein
MVDAPRGLRFSFSHMTLQTAAIPIRANAATFLRIG